MSEDTPAGRGRDHTIEEKSRLQVLSMVFGHSSAPVQLESGVKILPVNTRAATYEIQTPEQGAVDVIDVELFRSVRNLDDYIKQYENSEDHENLGRGVA